MTAAEQNAVGGRSAPRMMRQVELVDRVRRYNPHANEDLLNKAYVYAMKAHGAQKRASGDPYLSHPLEVAAILTDFKLDDATIVAAVLHDTIEDTASTKEEIDQIFGREIGGLVDGLTKLKKLDLVSKRAEQAENFRKLLLAVADDVRVLLVKLADRLHNMRTLQFVAPEKRARVAQETLEIYAPLAGRMGIQNMRDEMENISFHALMPDAAAMIDARLSELRTRNGSLIETIERELAAALANEKIKADVKGRQKSPYSVFRKIENKSLAFEQLSDIYGFRVIVNSIEECYRVLWIVHTRWPAVPDRFKDYLSTPKPNDYRSIHTTVVGPGRQRVELQIRTEAMHAIAEYGIAAHAIYKDGRLSGSGSAQDSNAYQWLRRTIDLLAGDSSEEFLEHTKLELFHDQVFCFTPKGRLIALPKGATPIDFAYAVHTGLGHSAVGAKINGRISPLVSELRNGDEVEITRADGQTPPAAWESVVVTGKARAAIRRATRVAVRSQYADLGRRLVARAFERANMAYSEEQLRVALPRLARQTVEDVLAAVGRSELSVVDVVRSIHPDYKDERKPPIAKPKSERGWFGLTKTENRGFKFSDEETSDALPIRGGEGEPVRFAPRGGAIPGDRIVAIRTPGEGITIYPIQSPALGAFDDQPDRWLDVRWDVEEHGKRLFPARLVVTSLNEPGALGSIATIIGEAGANIDQIEFVASSGPDFHDLILDLQVFDVQHLNAIMSQIRTKSVVSKVQRVYA